jgi:hypothetical protein
MNKIFSGSIIILFIALFLYTGIDKLLAHNQFSAQLRDSPLVASVSGVLEWMLPLTELITAFALCMNRLRLPGLYMAFVLMGIFTVYTAILETEYYDVPCSCGGFLERLPPTLHIALNIILTILAGTALWITKTLRKKGGYQYPK